VFEVLLAIKTVAYFKICFIVTDSTNQYFFGFGNPVKAIVGFKDVAGFWFKTCGA
jgi:hypothetical protein